MDLLLDVEWWGLDDKITPVLFVLPSPEKLWIDVSVTVVPRLPTKGIIR